ncbi:DUF2280 domain-containing protein [uncultured Castellaniella sp.]|uniref:DUF2280 domain-containing protein n=1 Tax=uncultured Castellaniella sp. TaxID=647907 RepID=UPI002623E5A0|nr:DUF2280 domain-containing protein [uncultured Castellaniella sp.]
MATLNDAAKRFIVQALACYDTPSEVSAAIKDEMGLDVARTQVAQYDPTKVAGAKLSQKWRDLFDETRKKFREAVAEIPIADQAFRLRSLGKIYDRHMARGNVVAAAAVLEQAAKEQGGMFTNKREVSGPNGGPIQQVTMDKDEFASIAQEMLKKV